MIINEKNMKIIIIKLGSSVFFTQANKLDEFLIANIAGQINSLKEKGVGIVLVVSGSVAYGANFVNFSKQNTKLKQVAAGIGQAYVISIFRQIFSKEQLKIAQVLLTKDLLSSSKKRQDIKDLLVNYLKMGIIPVINENDTIELNSFGGNDFLATEVAILLKAEQLLILSTMAGSTHGVGGGETKQQALAMLKKEKIKATIVDGKSQNIILRSLF